MYWPTSGCIISGAQGEERPGGSETLRGSAVQQWGQLNSHYKGVKDLQRLSTSLFLCPTF